MFDPGWIRTWTCFDMVTAINENSSGFIMLLEKNLSRHRVRDCKIHLQTPHSFQNPQENGLVKHFLVIWASFARTRTLLSTHQKTQLNELKEHWEPLQMFSRILHLKRGNLWVPEVIVLIWLKNWNWIEGVSGFHKGGKQQKDAIGNYCWIHSWPKKSVLMVRLTKFSADMNLMQSNECKNH